MNTKRMMCSLFASFVITGFVLIACVSQTWAAEPSRPWTTIGSVGRVGSCSPPADPPILEFVSVTVSLVC